MERIAKSELIINDRGGVYHLNLKPGEISNEVILVGDPDRVTDVSKHFDSIEAVYQHREFVTHTGLIGKKRLSVVSTGIGTDNIDIVLNELDALVNIDFETRTPKKTLTSLQVVRMGTSGSLQKEVPVDSLLASAYGLGIDNLLNFYVHQDSDNEKAVLAAFVDHMKLSAGLANPYISACDAGLLSRFANFSTGITVTCPGFYGPQGRVLRGGLSNPRMFDNINSFRFGDHQITNFEMETAGIYGMCKILGHKAVSLNAIIANRVTGQFSKDAKGTIQRLIKEGLEIIVK